jgi:hypothetical protein
VLNLIYGRNIDAGSCTSDMRAYDNARLISTSRSKKMTSDLIAFKGLLTSEEGLR